MNKLHKRGVIEAERVVPIVMTAVRFNNAQSLSLPLFPRHLPADNPVLQQLSEGNSQYDSRCPKTNITPPFLRTPITRLAAN